MLYEVITDTKDFIDHVKQFNTSLFNNFEKELVQLPESLDYFELKNSIAQFENRDLDRLLLEYLPLTFSRRHGDPSRPWNLFSIDIKEKDGSRITSYNVCYTKLLRLIQVSQRLLANRFH